MGGHDPHECDTHEHHGDEEGHEHEEHECDTHEHHADEHEHDEHECDTHEHHVTKRATSTKSTSAIRTSTTVTELISQPVG